jgi:hypothetical protein
MLYIWVYIYIALLLLQAERRNALPLLQAERLCR